jgi:hypothetical protein
MIPENLTTFVQEINKIDKKLRSYLALKGKGYSEFPYELSRLLTEIKTRFKDPKVESYFKNSPMVKELEEFFQKEEEVLAQYKEEFHFNMGRKLQELFASFGELKGQLPTLRIKYYTIKFDFNSNKSTLWWGPEKELIKNLALNPSSVFKETLKFHQKLTQRFNNYQEFKDLIRLAYQRYLSLHNLSWGSKVNLLELLGELVLLLQKKSFRFNPLRRNFTEYSRIYYSYDLYRLKTTEKLTSDLHLLVAPFILTQSKEKSLWVLDNEEGEGTYYYAIAFRT